MLDSSLPHKSVDPAANGLRALFPLELRHLTYSANGKRVIDDLDLSIDERGITVIMGPNGAGKSMLLRLMHGLIVPTSGEILWAGRRMSREIARRQAMVFQQPVLLRRSTAANVSHALGLRGIGRGERGPRVEEALRLAALEGRGAMPARKLSGGEQQRLCLARALSLEPDVLFLDEPTASLDPASTVSIEGLLVETQHRGIKLIVVTHDVGQARRLAQDIVFLNHGRVIEHRPTQSFFAEPQSESARTFIAGGIVL
jgi:tungstate transport system ATP-binding protein